MHIPDGYLGPETYGGLWAVMAPVWIYASKKVKENFDAARVPYLAMASAFTLVAMVFMVPLPGGTSGHISGATLVAIFLGPWAAVVAVSVALIIQALVFGDGGITAIGANCFNIAFVGSVIGYGIYAMASRFGSKFYASAIRGGGTGLSPYLTVRLVSAGIASYVAINLGGLFTALQLGLQPLLHPGGTGSSYFPYPLQIVIPAVVLPHLTVLGLLEATVTVLVLLVLSKAEPVMAGVRRSLPLLLVALFLVLPASRVSAHDYWIEKRGDDFMLVFGHGSQRLEFDASKVKTLKAFDDRGREMGVTKERKGTGILLKPEGQPSLLFVEVDDGYWSKTIYGWRNLPKRKASRVVESTRSFYYSKVLLSWSETLQRPLSEAKLDIMPLQDPKNLKAGDILLLRVFYQGNPISGVEVEGGDHQRVTTSDREGVAKVKLSKGHHLFSVNYREPLKNDPDADILSITSTLTFEVTK